jgi:hypothetical protein
MNLEIIIIFSWFDKKILKGNREGVFIWIEIGGTGSWGVIGVTPLLFRVRQKIWRKIISSVGKKHGFLIIDCKHSILEKQNCLKNFRRMKNIDLFKLNLFLWLLLYCSKITKALTIGTERICFLLSVGEALNI